MAPLDLLIKANANDMRKRQFDQATLYAVCARQITPGHFRPKGDVGADGQDADIRESAFVAADVS
jgi:hypothetical protein